MRLGDATTLFEGDVRLEKKGNETFLKRSVLLYTVEHKVKDEETGIKEHYRYEYTVDEETGACLRVVCNLLEENGGESGGASGFVCTEFDFCPADFSELIAK